MTEYVSFEIEDEDELLNELTEALEIYEDCDDFTNLNLI